ncbi:MAG: Asp-tRNA(Asn)/Glu-tRNA(Gln) amidotransferase GatCAB subunit A [Rhodospirillales bacterium]
MSEQGPVRRRLEAALARIDALNPTYRALVSVAAERARAEADHGDARRRAGIWGGPLDGVIVVAKDNIDEAGLRTAAGSRLFADYVPDEDAFVLRRVRKAGGIVIGKASMMELALGLRSLDAIAGQCRNPWAEDRVPGGSSGGSACAVALDFCQAALGTDTGGSVRMPAAFCGVTGLRPTHGRVSNDGVRPVSVSLDTVGPLARDVGDVARLYAVIAGYDPRDPHSRRRGVEDWTRDRSADVAGLKIGLPRHFYRDDLDPEIAGAVAAVARHFEAAGATLVEIEVPEAERAPEFVSRIILSDVCALYAKELAERRADVSDQVYERMIAGQALTAVDYAEALRFREAWARAADLRYREQVDATLIATTPTVAPPIEDNAHLVDATRRATWFTYGGSLAGVPGISFPCGFNRDGLPIGALLETRRWREDLLFRLVANWQAGSDWHRRRAAVD